VVNGHGGEITAAPGEHGGSVFTVRLPLAVEDDPALPAEGDAVDAV
jgi:signal transduction histidine kinase